jgi:hypothetical protein
MKAKKSLVSRIRGWFPQEPKLLGKYVQNSPKYEKKRLLLISVVLLLAVIIALAAFQIPRITEGLYPQAAIRQDDSNLSIQGVVTSVEENYRSEGWAAYHVFRYYVQVNISETLWVGDDLAHWENGTFPDSPLSAGHIVKVGYDYSDKPQITIGQTIECKGFYLAVTDSPQSSILTIAPAINGCYLKAQIS